MSKATLQFDLDNEHERRIHESAPNGWRYKTLIENVISELRGTALGEGVAKANATENALISIKKAAVKLDLKDIALQTGM